MKLTFSRPVLAADAGRRVIAGRIVTFGEVGHTSAGPTVFEAGSIDVPDDVVLVLEHDTTRPLGRALELSETPDGIDAAFRIAGTRRGDDALVEAADALRDGFSVGVDVIAHTVDKDGTLRVTASKLDHVGLVTRPAIDSARVDRVAASQENPPEGNTMSDTEAPEVVEVVEVVDTVEAARPATIRTAPRVKSFDGEFAAADYVLTFAAAARGDRDAAMRIAAADQSSDLNPGIVPKAIVGPVIDVLNGSRPVVGSSTARSMPSLGSTFSRPVIAQHTAAGKQTAEFDPLTSRTMSITAQNVVKQTHGGHLAISFQNRDWTDPAILSIVIDDLAKAYAVDTESSHATAFATAVTATEGIGTTPDAETFIKGMYLGAAKVAAGCGELPDTLWLAPDEWALIGSLVDTAKRPLFPSMGPVNAGGVLSPSSWAGNPLGLRMVVAPALAAGTGILGNSKYVEHYENVGGQLSVVNPSTLSFDLAFYGYTASNVTVPGAFVKLTKAAPVAADAKSK